MGAAEDADGDEADGAGDFPDVFGEVVPGGEGPVVEVGHAAVDDGEQERVGEMAAVAEFGEVGLEGGGVAESGGDAVFPGFEFAAAVFEGKGGVVGEVVGLAAERVEGDHVGAPGPEAGRGGRRRGWISPCG